MPGPCASPTSSTLGRSRTKRDMREARAVYNDDALVSVLVETEPWVRAVVGKKPCGDNLDRKGPEKVERNQPEQPVAILLQARRACARRGRNHGSAPHAHLPGTRVTDIPPQGTERARARCGSPRTRRWRRRRRCPSRQTACRTLACFQTCSRGRGGPSATTTAWTQARGDMGVNDSAGRRRRRRRRAGRTLARTW